MDMNEADILAGRAKSVSARHYAFYELDRLTDAYHHGWQKLGIVISRSSGNGLICYLVPRPLKYLFCR
jgi:hypothetical protein